MHEKNKRFNYCVPAGYSITHVGKRGFSRVANLPSKSKSRYISLWFYLFRV
jgi:hypothetical protein